MRALLLAIPLLLAALPPIEAASAPGGAFTCDFAVDPNSIPLDEIAPAIERDRMYMAERPGMIHKHIPMRPDPASGKLLTGGRYLFETEEHAAEYLRWVREDFALGGVPFLEREAFSDVDCHSWAAIGSAQFGDIRSEQVTLRTERWSAPDANQRAYLRAQWPIIEEDARSRGLSAVWLLYQKQEDLVTIISFAPRLALSPDAGIAAMEAAPTLGAMFDARGWDRAFDRTHWTFNVWFPYAFADRGEASIWTNSPPFPEPTSTDGVCVPSRGETHATAPDDCTPRCGDGLPDADETWERCPSDVRFWS